MRRFVISPMTETVPISFSRIRRMDPVSSETVRTFRTASTGNNSPNSHWLLTGLAMVHVIALSVVRERFGNAGDIQGAAGHLIDFDHRALQKNAPRGNAETPRLISYEPFHDRKDRATENAFMRAGKTSVAQ